jgi:hypothetical protein
MQPMLLHSFCEEALDLRMTNEDFLISEELRISKNAIKSFSIRIYLTSEIENQHSAFVNEFAKGVNDG